jgi:PAS domain S-box-containing protein
LISILGAYTARNLSERISDAHGRAWFGWLIGGATADGLGTWSMHYTGMLAFHLPIPVLYDWRTVLLSLAVGILGSAAALYIVSHTKTKWPRALAGAVMGGVGISGLHFIAMAAMRMQAMHHYSPLLVILSIVLAISISAMALWLMFSSGDNGYGHNLRNHGSAVLRGMANPVMHYTAMIAVTFTALKELPDLSHTVNISSIGIFGISAIPLTGLVVALLTTLLDRLHKQRVLLDELFEQAPQAVALMSADNQIVRINREFSRIFGYAPQEAVGRSLSELIVPAELQHEDQQYTAWVADGRRVDAEGVRRRQDNTRLYVSITRVPVSLPGGQIQIYAIFRDITERNRADEELRKSREQLRTLAAYLESVREDERTRIARELHDEIGQALTAIKLILEQSTGERAVGAAANLAQALDLANELIGRVRDLSLELRPAMLDDLGLMAALRWHFERYTAQCKITVSFKQVGLEGRRFAAPIETAAYRIVQEALTNVARHAHVEYVQVRIEVDEHMLRIHIQDFGGGFDPDSLSAGTSAGLYGMRERVIILGGDLRINSAPGSGTLLVAELPLGAQSTNKRR